MLPKNSSRVAIITPALAAAKNGNWQTARRWSEFIDTRYAVNVSMSIDTITAEELSPDVMIALHARRSVADIRTFAATGKPIAVVLTGTDLYGDTPDHPDVKESLGRADLIVVLQDEAIKLLPNHLQKKARVIYQSAPTLNNGPIRQDTFDIAFIGHLRTEKDPDTLLHAFQSLTDQSLRLIHVGRLDGYQELFSNAAAKDTRIVLKGSLDHEESLSVLAGCRLMLISSRMEGGANVIIEAVNSQVPVLASRISGNVGMLGNDYPGYFSLGNSAELATLVQRSKNDPTFLELLKRCGQKRASRFLPQTEKDSVLLLVETLLQRSMPNALGQ
jgi:putative glycosyltransferase (TIGR04348 family)